MRMGLMNLESQNGIHTNVPNTMPYDQWAKRMGGAQRPAGQQQQPGALGQQPQQPNQQPQAPQLGNTNIYNPQQSQQAVNLTRAQIHQQTTLPGLLEQAARPGMGAGSPYALGQALTTGVAPGQVASQLAGAQIPFGDQEANARNRLQYEDMAAGQSIGYGNVANRIQSAQRGASLQNANTLASLLAGLL